MKFIAIDRIFLFVSNDDKNPVSKRVPSRSECGLPETGFLFCRFNNTYKIKPQMFDAYSARRRKSGMASGSAVYLAFMKNQMTILASDLGQV